MRYGDDLLCVHYRMDASGARRYTTVELGGRRCALGAAERKPATQVARGGSYGRHPHPLWRAQLRALAREAGARWDADAKLWRTKSALLALLTTADGYAGSIAVALGLLKCEAAKPIIARMLAEGSWPAEAYQEALACYGA